MGQVGGIDVGPVTDWITQRTEATPPLDFEVIQGGRSNLTYTVTDAAGQRLILRRPPLHGVPQSAHDMGREHRIITALADAAVPVPRTVGYEPDDAVTGAPFYVMRFVEGEVVRDAEAARARFDADTRAAASADLVDVLVRLHEVDVDAVGLGDLARKEDYLARQFKRWHGQSAAGRRSAPARSRRRPRAAGRRHPGAGPGDDRARRLPAGQPHPRSRVRPGAGRTRLGADHARRPAGRPRPVDGVLGRAGRRRPAAARLADDRRGLLDPRTDRGPRRRGLRRDISELDYYVAFGYWKRACILEGVYSRFASGAYGDTDDSFQAFGDMVLALGARASEAAARAGR